MTMLYVNFYDADRDITGFVLTCEHADTNRLLEGDRRENEAEVLAQMIESHRTAVVQGNEHLKAGEEPVICLCQPVGWIRGEPMVVR